MRHDWRPETISGDALRYYRYKAGLSQRDVGRILGLSHRSICDYEIEHTMPTFGVARALARLYGCEVLDLYNEPPEPGPQRTGPRKRSEIEAAAKVTLEPPPEETEETKEPEPQPDQEPLRKDFPRYLPTCDLTALCRIRKELGMTQSQFALKLRVSLRMLSRWESGENGALWSRVRKIAKALDMEPAEFADPPVPPRAR